MRGAACGLMGGNAAPAGGPSGHGIGAPRARARARRGRFKTMYKVPTGELVRGADRARARAASEVPEVRGDGDGAQPKPHAGRFHPVVHVKLLSFSEYHKPW